MAKYIKTPSYVDSMPVDISFVFKDEKPAGKHGFLKTAGEEFRFEDGTPARFWGVCMNGAACFPSHEYAEKVSDRLAMAGINAVRLHQLDGEYHTPNIFQYRKGERLKSTRTFDPKSLDRLDYFVKCLKERGIYCYLDMMVFRHFKSGDGVVDAEGLCRLGEYGGKPYSLFDRTMIELQKEYATNLWTHFNPYTGLAYKDDPVFILSEIVNESDMWIKSHHPSKKETPFEHIPFYEEELRDLFRDWVKETGEAVDPETVDVWDMENDVLNRFKLEIERRFNKEMYDHIRSLGVRIPITASNRLRSIGYNVYAQEGGCDYMDNHHYYYDWTWGEEEKFGPNFQINGYPHVFRNLPTLRIAGRPFYVSEWDMPWPNCFRAEGPVYYAAMCAFQGWSGMGIHTYAYGTNLEHVDIIGKEASSSTLGGVPYREGIFSAWNDPAKFGLFYHSALMVRRGDVSQGKKKIGVRIPFVEKMNLKAFETGLEIHRMVTLLDGMEGTDCDEVIDVTDAVERETPDRIVSDSGELWRDLKNKFGGVDTPRTKILYGKLAKINQGVSPKPGTEVTGMKVESYTDFAVVALSSLNDTPIESSDNMLLSAIGRARNTDAQFDGEKLIDYGHAPIISEAIHARITLKTDRKDLRVWGINAEGYYVGVVPSKFEDGKMIFTIGEQFPCLYYLINAE